MHSLVISMAFKAKNGIYYFIMHEYYKAPHTRVVCVASM